MSLINISEPAGAGEGGTAQARRLVQCAQRARAASTSCSRARAHASSSSLGGHHPAAPRAAPSASAARWGAAKAGGGVDDLVSLMAANMQAEATEEVNPELQIVNTKNYDADEITRQALDDLRQRNGDGEDGGAGGNGEGADNSGVAGEPKQDDGSWKPMQMIKGLWQG